MQSQRIAISVSKGFFDAYLSLPPEGEGPGILLIQEIFGVNEHIRKIADNLAESGYVVLAPDLFWRIKPNIELSYTDDDFKKGLAYMEKFDEEEGLSDLKHAANALRNHSACTGRIGAIGFCLGGKLTYRLAAATNLNVAVAYYGVSIDQHLSEAEKIKCSILMHFAGEDKYVNRNAYNRITNELSSKPNFKIELYEGVDHGFNCDARANYNKEAAELAWGRTTALFEKELKK